ncbi:hypothetical protein [Bacillus sp. HMF5848]|nr:hypothetical protein [Bacillus sp. HMF5848]
MVQRDSHKNQQQRMKQASDAVNQNKDFGYDPAEKKRPGKNK